MDQVLVNLQYIVAFHYSLEVLKRNGERRDYFYGILFFAGEGGYMLILEPFNGPDTVLYTPGCCFLLEVRFFQRGNFF